MAAAFAAVRQAHERFGRLDVVVNNAGYGHFGMIEEVTENEIRAQLETNVLGALWVTQAALPYLREQGSDLFPHEMAAFEKNLNEYLPNDRHVARPWEDVALFFESATLLTPGVVRVSDWRPDTAEEPLPTTLWSGVARK